LPSSTGCVLPVSTPVLDGNLDQYIAVLESQATADAKESDGIDRDTVNVFVLDKKFEY
jgi:hypothetical protein